MNYIKPAIALAAMFIFSPLIVRAAECDLSPKTKALEEALAAPAGDYLASLRLELQARKELLSAVIGCMLNENRELENSLAGLPDTEALRSAKAELIQEMRNARGYLERQLAEVPNLGIQGTKNYARELRSWREGAYAQIQAKANNLKIWSGNEALFETAGKRLEQIGQTVRLLKLLENDEIKSMYEKSGASLKTAGDIHRRSLENIKNYRPQEEISASLKNFLEALSQTYKNFLDLSQAVKKILPL